MKNAAKRILALTLAMVLCAGFFAPITGRALNVNTDARRYNIMLVIDGSGSLISANAGSTDPYGMRYELIDELMGILEDDGHNVGAIVFSGTRSISRDPSDADMEQGIMLNTGLLSLDQAGPDGRNVKGYVANMVRQAGVDNRSGSCTDIGTALLVAQKALVEKQQENGLESMVFLFTDGNTAFSRVSTEVVNKSQANRDTAVREMLNNGIRLFGAFLNKNGNQSDAEMKDIVCGANGISRTSAEFAYSYCEIQDSDSVHAATTAFLKFLGMIPDVPDQILTRSFTDEFMIPGVGVKEMVVRLFSPQGEDISFLKVQFTMPDGTIVEGVPTTSSRTYRIYKLINPDPGKWVLHVTVPEGNMIGYCYNPILSMDIGVQLQPSVDPADMLVNSSVDFTCLLTQSGNVVTDPAKYIGYDCVLEVRNLDTDQVDSYTVPVTGKNIPVVTVPLDAYGNHEAQVTFTCGEEIVVSSAPISMNLYNRMPSVNDVTMEFKCGLFQTPALEVDLAANASDPEDGQNLVFRVESATCREEGFRIVGDRLEITTGKIGDGDIVISATDTQGGSANLTVHVDSTNVTVYYVIALVTAILLIIAIVSIITIGRNKIKPMGDLTVSLELPRDGGRVTPITLNLAIPGTGTTSKTNLDKLLKDALRDEALKVAQGIYAPEVKDYVSTMSASLSQIVLTKTAKKKKNKKIGAVAVKQGSKKTVLFNSRADFYADNVCFTLEFIPMNAGDDGGFDDPFSAPVTPVKNQNKQAQDDLFDDLF